MYARIELNILINTCDICNALSVLLFLKKMCRSSNKFVYYTIHKLYYKIHINISLNIRLTYSPWIRMHNYTFVLLDDFSLVNLV